mgnify:CR=1 FL=1
MILKHRIGLQGSPHCLQCLSCGIDIALDHGSRPAAFGLEVTPHAISQFLTVAGRTSYDKAVTIRIVSGKNTAVTGIFFSQSIDSIAQSDGIQLSDEEKHVAYFFRGGKCIHWHALFAAGYPL